MTVAIFSLLLTSRASAQFVEVSTQVGLSQEEKKSWGSPIWGDMNNDGFLDLIVPTHGLASSGGPLVYLNNAGTNFTDIRSTCNIGAAPSFDTKDWHGYAFGDYDGDGNLDLYISEGAKGQQGGTTKRDLLFRGNGDGTFTNVSEAAGIQVTTHRGRIGAWFDYNNDGYLDLFVKNYADENDLYQNNGNGTFSVVPNAAGLAQATDGIGFGGIIAVADYDNDGFMDIAISGDGNAHALYRNLGNGTYSDVTSAAGISATNKGKGLAWGDYNNDGLLDLFVARYQQNNGTYGGALYRNNGNGTFTDVAAEAGVKLPGNNWAGVWGDYDNDGYLDLFLTNSGSTGNGPGNANRLFHNNGDGTFTNVAAAQGVELQDNVSLPKGAAWADYNNDGFLDLVIKDGIGNESDNGDEATGIQRLFKNTPNGNHFIKVKLVGVRSNKQGIGARVTLRTPNGLVAFRENTGDGGGNLYSQGSQPLHFGIGTAGKAAKITIAWPSGTVDSVSNVNANSTITVVESGEPNPTPSPTATPIPTPAPPVITKQPANRHVTEGESARFAVTATGAAPLAYQWKKNGVEITGATSNIYNTPPTTLSDDGTTFAVVVSNPGGNATSKNVQLSVAAAPAGGPISP